MSRPGLGPDHEEQVNVIWLSKSKGTAVGQASLEYSIIFSPKRPSLRHWQSALLCNHVSCAPIVGAYFDFWRNLHNDHHVDCFAFRAVVSKALCAEDCPNDVIRCPSSRAASATAVSRRGIGRIRNANF